MSAVAIPVEVAHRDEDRRCANGKRTTRRGRELPDPLPSRTVMVFAPELAVTRSSLPSPLKSAIAMDYQARSRPQKGLAVAAVKATPIRCRAVL